MTLFPQVANEWSESNAPLMPHSVKPRSSKCVWWHCSVCGHEWPARIDSRTDGRANCPNCKAHVRLVQSAKIDPVSAVLYYAAQTGTEARKNDDSVIGVPLDVFLPVRNAAIVFTHRKQRTMEYKREYAINDLCRKSGILLIRIIHKDAMGHDTCRCITRLDDSDEALSLALSVVFEWLCIDTDIDVERDRTEIIRYDGKYIEGVCKSVSKVDFSLSV